MQRLKTQAWSRFLLLAVCLATSNGVAYAHGKDKHSNLKVIPKAIAEKEIDRGMKLLSKGLGVRCTACHVKGHYEEDSVKEKEKARAFLKAVLGEIDADKRKLALQDLMKALRLTALKDESKLWQAVDVWHAKP